MRMVVMGVIALMTLASCGATTVTINPGVDLPDPKPNGVDQSTIDAGLNAITALGAKFIARDDAGAAPLMFSSGAKPATVTEVTRVREQLEALTGPITQVAPTLLEASQKATGVEVAAMTIIIGERATYRMGWAAVQSSGVWRAAPLPFGVERGTVQQGVFVKASPTAAPPTPVPPTRVPPTVAPTDPPAATVSLAAATVPVTASGDALRQATLAHLQQQYQVDPARATYSVKKTVGDWAIVTVQVQDRETATIVAQRKAGTWQVLRVGGPIFPEEIETYTGQGAPPELFR